ncbi:hypothetical protein DFP89_103132 [Paracoccus lutimaris]|uniref:Uncharacterized protein n=1 Tax=Paracoccus lutimaris TaxID=1490030 RepID=A0A368Z5S1_9RHOB|nr:hypothetical protein DFP89_103132 [Paracoccus lutimaris]
MIVEFTAAAEADLERITVLHVLNGAMDVESILFSNG